VKEQPKDTQKEKSLELTRETVRKQSLDQFKQARTCILARELCYIIRMDRAVFEKEDVRNCCLFVSNLCKDAGCNETSTLCAKAAEAVLESEKTYLELCSESCNKCNESKQLRRQQPDRTIYVA